MIYVLCVAAISMAVMVSAECAGSGESAGATESTGSSLQWRWRSVGPGGGGMAMAFAADPVDKNTFYFASDMAGVFKSTDGGNTWQCKNIGQEGLYITEIVIKPDARNVVFAASVGGLYKSTNGGESWTLKRNGFSPTRVSTAGQVVFSAPVGSLAIDPFNTNTIYAGMDSYSEINKNIASPNADTIDGSKDSGGKIYKSTDCGENWSLANTPGNPISIGSNIRSIVCSPNNSGTLYAANGEGVYKSSDGGVTWAAKNSGLPHTHTLELAINPIANPDELYVTIYTPEGSWNGGVYKSSDGANSWIAKNNGLDKATGRSLYASQYRNIVIDPKNPSTLYVANASWDSTGGVYKSTDGGDLWTKITSSGNVEPAIWNTFVANNNRYSVRIIGISPVDPNILIFGTEFEVYKTADGGTSWTSAYADEVTPGTWKEKGEFDYLAARVIAVDPTNLDRVYICMGDVSFVKSTNGAASFSWAGYGINPGNGLHPYNAVHSVVIDPSATNILYAGAGSRLGFRRGGGLYKSVNYAEKWNLLAGGKAAVGGLPEGKSISIVIDPTSSVDSRTIYTVVFEHGIYKSTDGGSNWSTIHNGLTLPHNAESITIDPNDANTLYAAIRESGVFKTTNCGDTWTNMSKGSTSPKDSYIVAIDPSNSDVIYAGTFDDETFSKGGIYKSTDGGASWIQVYDGVHQPCWVRALIVDPDDPNIIYAGLNDNPWHDKYQSEGFLVSEDSGVTWTAHNEGMYVRNIRSMTVVKGSATGPLIYVGTHGGGAFKLDE
jgi:photosystem II stability/assembly factor-like uncharacterized protein